MHSTRGQEPKLVLQFQVLTLASGTFTNTTNKLMYLYGSATVTSITGPNASQTALTVSLPMWLPPGWTVTGTSGQIIPALIGDVIEDFRGFLSNARAAITYQQPHNSGMVLPQYPSGSGQDNITEIMSLFSSNMNDTISESMSGSA